MCWTDRESALNRFKQRASPDAPLSGEPPITPENRTTSVAETGTRDAWFLRSALLGKFGNVGTFHTKVREAGLGTSVTPKLIGSVVKDPTRQS